MLRELKYLNISQLTAEINKTLGNSIERMKHLQELYLSSINEDEILDLQCISSPPSFLCYLDLRSRLQQLPN